MSDYKELRSIELASYTTLTTGIAVLFSIIVAIMLSVIIGAMVPNGISIIIYLIPAIIIGTFMYTIYSSFCQGLLYNLLAKKLKTIAVEIKDGNEIVKISTTETAMMCSIILTIQVILIYLASALILPLLLSTTMQTLMYSGQQAMAYNIYQAIILITQPSTIAMFIFGVFIITFVFVLLGTYIYNILGKRERGAILNLSKEGSFTAIDSFDGLRLAIAFAIIELILNLIVAVIMVISGIPITSAFTNVLSGFVGAFFLAYLCAKFYNFLAPKLGKIKLELVDFKIN